MSLDRSLRIVRLIYLDEAGSSTDEVQEPILTVAATVLHGDLQTLPVEADARAIVETLVPGPYRAGFDG